MDTGIQSNLVSIVVPTYRSALFIGQLVDRLTAVFAGRTEQLEIILVNDASPDDTWDRLVALHKAHPETVRVVRLLKNSGQHNAILCGLGYVRGDVVVTIDDDMQHPPEELPKLLDKLREGYDLVIGAYNEKKHTGYRNRAGGLIDRVIRWIYGLPASLQLTSFRAVKRSVVDVARRSNNPYPYITCILFDQVSRVTNVVVRHDERSSGTTSYSMSRSLMLASNILFSYSSLPLVITAAFAGVSALMAMGLIIWILVDYFTNRIAVPGWASLMVVVSFFAAMMFSSIFMLGIYVARIHHQLTGRRVPFTVDEQHG
jgi:polyisoprenyl-phosphate glycosyltransferase